MKQTQEKAIEDLRQGMKEALEILRKFKTKEKENNVNEKEQKKWEES